MSKSKRLDLISDEQKAFAESEIKQKQKEIKYDLRDFTIDYIVQQFRESEFYVPDYQRKFIWQPPNKCRFVESVILGLPIPMMFLADMDDGRLEIVDGAQRIQTLEAFMSDDITLKELSRLSALNGFVFSDLPISQRRKFGTKALRLVVLEDETSLETRQEIFDRVNTSGVRARPSEVRRGTYAGKFMEFVTECSIDPLFKKLCPMSEGVRNRREGEELVVRFFAYSDRLRDFRHDVNKFLDKYVEDVMESFDRKEMSREFQRMLEFVDRYFPHGFTKKRGDRSTPRVRFEAISVGINLALREDESLVPGGLNDWLQSNEFKTQTTTHASNSGPRLRGRVLFVKNALQSNKRS